MKTLLCFIFAATTAVFGTPPPAPVHGESPPPPSLASPGEPAAETRNAEPKTTTPASVSAPTIEHNGQTFTLANHSSTGNVETDEYVPTGERLSDWSQLLTVQRLALAAATAPGDFLAYFQRRIEAENSAKFEILHESKEGSVFTVMFPKSERNEEQIMVCLAFADSNIPARLNVVQFALKPARISPEQAQNQLGAWRAKFLRQAGGASLR